jgi:type II secretory pathway component GspD/PulD (secretin)
MGSELLNSLILAALVTLGGNRQTGVQCEAKSSPSSPTPAHVDPPADTAKMVQVVYPVAELVIPIAQGGGVGGEGSERPWRLTTEEPIGQGSAGTNEARLMELIRTTVSPASWREQGGRGTMDFFPLGLSLVVSQTSAVQAEVAQLLAALRRIHDTEVAVEIRVLRVSNSLVEAFGQDWKALPPEAGTTDAVGGTTVKVLPGEASLLKGLPRPAILDDRQVVHLLQAAQGDISTCVLQAPRLVVLNGQRARVDSTRSATFLTGLDVVAEGEHTVAVPRTKAFETGMKLMVRPVVSADRGTIRMDLQGSLTALVSSPVPQASVTTHLKALSNGNATEEVVPVHQVVQRPTFQTLRIDKSFHVSNGKTALLVWGDLRVEVPPERDRWAEVVSWIPLLEQFVPVARPQSYSYARTVLVLITPRVVISEEGEKSAGQEQSEEDW